MAKNIILTVKLLVAVMTIFINNYASALVDNEIYYSNQCLSQFSHYEKIHKIPANLLKAVSLTESGKWHEPSKNMIPWPWAVNFQGKSYYHPSKREALSFVRKLQQQGHKSIDIGCMQINLYYHPEAFDSLEEAFEPVTNIAYAATFLKSNFNKHEDWHQAVASYHSDDKSLGWPYARKVVGIWKNIDDTTDFKVRSNKQLVSNHQKFLAKKKSLNSNFSSSSRRKKSDMFIRVYKPNISQKNYKMIESIANNAVANFGSK
jgi:hypothetical protein